MRLFESSINDVRVFTGNTLKKGFDALVYDTSHIPVWPGGKKGTIVMQADTAVELGNPREESSAFLMWTEDASLVCNGKITLIGPDLPESSGGSLPFGKVVILGVKGVGEENCHEMHREIELMRYDMNLDGYMMRAVSQRGREWSRVSRDAVMRGFSLGVLGASLIRMYLTNPHVVSAELLFVTSSGEDVMKLGEIGNKAVRLIEAMNKMASEYMFDCDSCDYSDVCSEVEGLRNMKKAANKKP